MTSEMPNMQEMLRQTILSGNDLYVRFLEGFNDGNRTTQADGLPNHAAWTLGHCALVMHRVAERLDDSGLPESDFVIGDGRSGDSARFDSEGVFIGSHPEDDGSLYPSWDRCLEIFDHAIQRLARASSEASDAALLKRSPWLSGSFPKWQLVQRAVFHNAAHSGQLIDLRRALSLGSVIVLPTASSD